MKPSNVLAIFLMICGLQGCGSLSAFRAGPRYVVSNKSPGIIVILHSYADRNANSACPIAGMQTPEVTTALFRGIEPSWQKLSSDKYVLDNEQCSLRVAIIPGASATIPFTVQTGVSGTEAMRLTITGVTETVLLRGEEIFERFERQEEELYVYAFP
jgi:hypothetical protein